MKTKNRSTLSVPAIRSSGKTSNKGIHRRRFAAGLGALLFLLVTSFLPSQAQAKCEQWDVSGTWQIVQSNGNSVEMILRTSGTEVTGTARDIQDLPRIPVTGTMVGNKFNLTIYWKGGAGPIGVYRGTVDSGGAMRGTTFNRRDRGGARVTWYSDRAMVCASTETQVPTPVESASPASTPKPLKSTGRKLVEPTPRPLKSTGRKLQSTVSPTISAHPRVVTIPDGQSTGTVTLTWDGGPDHPGARPWLKEGGHGEERMVADQEKGSRPVTVERGKNYQFLLMDSGQQLAKTVVLTRQ